MQPVKLRTNLVMLLAVIVLISTSCKKTHSQQNDTQQTDSAFFAKGADISWLTEMESNNYKFYTADGQQEDCMQILKGLGMNAIRLRAWVNPPNNWCGTTDLLQKAIRAKNLGFKILIDFHYSDSWADPGKQNKPLAWQNENFSDLQSSVHDYTFHVLDTLRTNGIIPDWVQIGNETDDGMLWEDGRASTNMAQFATLVKAGYMAVKSVSDSIKVIVHISNGYNNTLFRWVFDGLKSNGANWDIIGMSLYPDTNNWQALDQECLDNMNDMVSRYGTAVMICETGMDVTAVSACGSFLSDIISKNKSLAGNKGLGVFYWEPESYNWQGYTKGAFDNNGKPTAALNSFKN